MISWVVALYFICVPIQGKCQWKIYDGPKPQVIEILQYNDRWDLSGVYWLDRDISTIFFTGKTPQGESTMVATPKTYFGGKTGKEF